MLKKGQKGLKLAKNRPKCLHAVCVTETLTYVSTFILSLKPENQETEEAIVMQLYSMVISNIPPGGGSVAFFSTLFNKAFTLDPYNPMVL